MFTIIGADGKEYGPVSADKIREWIAAGRANSQTQGKREGDSAWSTLGSLGEFSASFGATPPPVGGGTPLAAAPTGGGWQPRDIDPKAYAAAIRASGARVDVFECLSRSFQLWTSNFLPLVGATILVILVQFAIGIVPILGSLAGLLLNGVFYGGLYYYYLGKMRGEPREIGDAFAGFKRGLGPLILCSLIQSAIMIAVLLVFMAPWLGFIVSSVLLHGDKVMPAMAPGLIALTSIGVLLMLYIGVSICFSFVLVIDKGLGPWDAIVTSWRVVAANWFSVFFTLLLGVLLGALGLIALFVGILLTIPLTIGAVLYAYESLFAAPGPAAPAPAA
ncbi:MAG: hypothetical protein C0502_00155 [Opitutus sp.]|nr:hypothetical protein [Opitutus sp.]